MDRAERNHIKILLPLVIVLVRPQHHLGQELLDHLLERPETVYTSLSFPALLSDWLITLTLTLTLINCDNIILD